eukprot:2618825-Heterocapsa_arctica.AAC.1
MADGTADDAMEVGAVLPWLGAKGGGKGGGAKGGGKGGGKPSRLPPVGQQGRWGQQPGGGG